MSDKMLMFARDGQLSHQHAPSFALSKNVISETFPGRGTSSGTILSSMLILFVGLGPAHSRKDPSQSNEA